MRRQDRPQSSRRRRRLGQQWTLAPFEEVIEQLLALALFHGLDVDAREKLFELLALGVELLLPRLPDPLLGALEALPAGQFGGKDGVLPLLVPGRLVEFRQAREEGFDELVDAPVVIQGIGNWSFSDIEKGRADWITAKKIRILLQLGLTGSQSPLLRDVPLVLDIVRNDEQRYVFKVLMGMKAMGRPYFVAPGVPKDRTDALRSAFMVTMRDPEFLAEATKTLGEIDPLTGLEMQKIIADLYVLPPEVIAKARETVKASGAN